MTITRKRKRANGDTYLYTSQHCKPCRAEASLRYFRKRQAS